MHSLELLHKAFKVRKLLKAVVYSIAFLYLYTHLLLLFS